MNQPRVGELDRYEEIICGLILDLDDLPSSWILIYKKSLDTFVDIDEHEFLFLFDYRRPLDRMNLSLYWQDSILISYDIISIIKDSIGVLL